MTIVRGPDPMAEFVKRVRQFLESGGTMSEVVSAMVKGGLWFYPPGYPEQMTQDIEQIEGWRDWQAIKPLRH